MSKSVIGFHYTLTDKEGNTIDSSRESSPLLFLEGVGQIIPGLENEIIALNVGDKKKVEVKASEAYGEVVEELRITVKKDQFPEDATLNVGDQFQVTNEEGAPVFSIIKIEENDVHVDGNHPMAGKDLFFEVEVMEKREATKEEIAHGHAHGAGGHHH